MKHFDYYKPRSLDEALDLKKKIPESKFIAGGTDLMVQIKSGEAAPSALLSLRSIPELSSIEINGKTSIGALVTVADLVRHPNLRKHYPLLVEAARRLGGPQIRNVATVGGNLCNCSPCADLALPLLVLEAQVKFRNDAGIQVCPIEDFFRGPGESCLSSATILTEILIGPPSPHAKGVFMKKGRIKMDLAIASLAVLLEMKETVCRKARIAAGSVAPVPLRLVKVESLLEGKEISPELVRQARNLAKESVAPITDIRATEKYRREIVGVYTKRSLEFILGGREL